MTPLADYARTALAALADTFFPQACLGCGTTISGRASRWCEPCFRSITQAVNVPGCPTCGRDVGPYEVVAGRCGRCSQERYHHDGLVRVSSYGGTTRGIIRRYKFAGEQRLDAALGGLLADRIEGAPWRADIEAVVPVPSHWLVRCRRRFFSTGALAREAARRLRVPYAEVLARPKAGPSQIGLTATDRRRNVRGKFALRRGACVRERTLCLVDDVMVTGATLQENIRVLKRAGAKAVYVAVLARADAADAASVDV